MAIQTGDTFFTGTQDGICGYESMGIRIVRASSSLTGQRLKADPAFENFCKAGNRMKQASPIASALYNQIPKEKKQFSLYRFLTGEAFKMIKQGIDKSVIAEKLQKLYIDPVLPNTLTEQPSSAQNPSAIQSNPGCQYLGRVKGYRKLKLWRVATNTDQHSSK
jgi:hypothetical protein